MDILPQLSHGKLEVYQKSIQFLTLSAQVVANTPLGFAELCDQLKRAALSVPLNIAEASGRTGSLDHTFPRKFRHSHKFRKQEGQKAG